MASGLRSVVVLCFVCSFLSVESRSVLDNGEAPAPPGRSSGCALGWTQFGSRCFIFYHAHKTWMDAERFCMSIGGNLASIHSGDESVFISDLTERVTGRLSRTWVGGSDAVADGKWRWSDGSMFNHLNWANGEPNNYKGNGGNEDCLIINFAGKFWNDDPCHFRFPFVCAKKL